MRGRRHVPGVAARCAAAFAVVSALLLAACASSSSAGGEFHFTQQTALGKLIPVAQREPAEDIGGNLVTGGSRHLGADAGKVVVVNFWASWCEPCQVETPQLSTYYQAMRGEGVTVLGIDTKDDKSAARSFITDKHIKFPVVYDQQGENALRLGNIPVAGLPFTVLVDKRGRVAAVYITKLTPKDLQGPVNTLRAEP